MAAEAQLDILQGKTRRGAARRKVTLRGRGTAAEGEATEVLIHNLSESGVLLESTAKLAVGEKFVIDLPGVERISAKVVWAGDDLFGCAFDHPVPRAAVSAAQLRSAPEERFRAHPPADGNDPLPEQGEAFGARLKRLRMQSGLSLVEFARRVNVSRPTVWSWEAGRSTPRESKIPALLSVLGVSERELSGLPEEPRFEHAADEAFASETELRSVIREAKARVAEIAGTSPDKVKLIIEV